MLTLTAESLRTVQYSFLSIHPNEEILSGDIFRQLKLITNYIGITGKDYSKKCQRNLARLC